MPANFPKPWTFRELEESYVVEDGNSFAIVYVIFETRPPERIIAGERMTKAQARAIARRIAEIGK